jgi:hypothetical protein
MVLLLLFGKGPRKVSPAPDTCGKETDPGRGAFGPLGSVSGSRAWLSSGSSSMISSGELTKLPHSVLP